MWIKQSSLNATDENGNEIFYDFDLARKHMIIFRSAKDNSTELIFSSACPRDILEYIDWFVESQNAAERDFHFSILGETCWR